MNASDLRDLRGRRVVLMGLGRFGGGVGAARFLAQRGADLLVTDQADEDALRASLNELADLPNISYRLGEHVEADFATADLVVANPAVKPGNRYLDAAREAGVSVTSEIRLVAQLLPNRRHVIGVTGTAGKSTVTAMIGHVLKKMCDGRWTMSDVPDGDDAASHRTWISGNIGGSLLPHIDEIRPEDWIVLELSSFMLDGLCEARWSPHIAVLTNFSPNHIDWHGSVEAYHVAKQAIYAFQHDTEGDVAVAGPGVREVFTPCVNDVREVSGDGDMIDLPLPGNHNQLNARLALVAVEALLGAARSQTAAALTDFTGLPHRLQLVAEHAGVRYFNDSKATTPDAAMLAIDSFELGTAHVILGGSDKGSDLTTLARHAATRCRAIYTIGQVGNAIAESAEHAPQRVAEIARCGDLDTAMGAIVQRIHRGDAVVLSPGCASYDQFANFEQRGQRFTEAVLRYSTETGVSPRSKPL